MFGSTVSSEITITPSDKTISAALDPSDTGAIYRVTRNIEGTSNCDYVQDLGSLTPFANIRTSADPLVIAARATLNSAIVAAIPTTVEAAACSIP
jgi:hypothetical protein